MSSDPEYTFLGSIILATDSRSELTLDGTSLTVIDGQHGVTFHILMACALFQLITEHRDDISKLSNDTESWSNAEIKAQLNHLGQCAIGQVVGIGTSHPYPRMIPHQ